jgi:predicted MPP superfamily phosphohydrolase
MGSNNFEIFVIAVSVACILSICIHYYIWVRLVRNTQLAKPWKRVLTVGIVCLCIGMNSSMYLGMKLPLSIGQPLLFLPRVWMGMIPCFFIVLVFSDFLKVLRKGFRRVQGEGPLEPERRLFFSRMAAGASTMATGSFACLAVPNALLNVAIIKRDIFLSKLPGALDGFTIAHLTDLHIGSSLGGKWLEDVVARTNQLKPDAVVITGDMLDGTPERILEEVRPIAGLKAPGGVFFATGNHEYYAGVTEWLPILTKDFGLRVLLNERISIGRGNNTFDLAGIPDYHAENLLPGNGPDLEKTLKGRDKNRELILLAHQPRAVYEAAKHDVGLVLSGHTHGGQFWPFGYFVYIRQPYIKGLHRHTDRTQIYINQGTGFWGPPMRAGTKGEITLHTLRRV